MIMTDDLLLRDWIVYSVWDWYVDIGSGGLGMDCCCDLDMRMSCDW